MSKTYDFDMKEIINHLKENGFIFQGSQLYGGLANSWDYGPLGVALKNKIKANWWNFFIKNSNYNLGLDSSILLNSQVWKASGHLQNFNDPLIDCKNCKSRFRADNLINHYFNELEVDGWNNEQLQEFINKEKIKCLKCQENNFTNVRQFQLMFETQQGSLQDAGNKLYLRPETAQGIFINFNNIKNTFNKKLPFGIGQIGKSFRNEITPGNFIFRTLEFEQMELEFFFDNKDGTNWFNYWVEQVENFIKSLGLEANSYRLKQHKKEELSHYALATTDIQYYFPFGWKELCGIANRGDYDLKAHSKHSNTSLVSKDLITNENIIPYVIEPSMGVERLLLAIICESLTKETKEGKERTVLKLNEKLVPYHVAISSLHKKKLGPKAYEIYKQLQNSNLDIIYEEKPNIGKVYNYHDSIGTLFCLTVDYDSENDNCVTIRHRDSTEQKRVKIKDLKTFIYKELKWI